MIRHENKRENVAVLVGRFLQKDFDTLVDKACIDKQR
jgi:hypothetical protein